MNDWDKKFYLGLGILFVWCIVMALCASPQLFRDKIVDILCCQPGESRRRKQHLEKVKAAHERAKSISMSCGAMTGLVTRPSQILVAQAVGPIWEQSILETDREMSSEPCTEPLSIVIDPRR
uniref:Uncharacterized protein n=1 Tax=Panagrellus redivivus TaxID=6233 RepID=A0A7E4UWW5_PANRE